MLGIEKIVDPGDFVTLLVKYAIGASAGLEGRWMGQDEFHNECAPSRQSAKLAAAAPATK